MRRTDKFYPVVTIVIYYGEKPWDGAKSLYEMLEIPEEMKPYVNDYKVQLVEAGKKGLRLQNRNNIDLFHLFGILLSKKGTLEETRNQAVAYAREHKVDKSVVMTVAGAANCRLDYNLLDREVKGESDMWTIFEETKIEGRAEGRAEGKAEEIIETGLEFGLSEDAILKRLQKKLDIPLGKAQEYLEMFGKQKV